ncbi:MAG: hypothetical protein NTZ95_05950 [Candidatus Omnitrophica bacterium]|nr:hypothetical protein [Candidatus Omnitrophota bacterium]
MPKTLEGTRRSFPTEDVLLEHIASTYFAKKSRPKTKSRKKSPSLKDAAFMVVAAGTIVAAIGFILIVSSITNKNYNELLRKKISALQVIPLFDKGAINKDVVKRLELLGYARGVSSKAAKDALVLKNPKKYNWADALLPLRFPVDLNSRTLNLSIRGAKGGEKITIILKDSSNRSLRLGELYLSSNWRTESIPLGRSKNYIDLANINAIRIEYGRIGEAPSEKDSLIETMIYLKDINLPKEA